MSSDNPVLELSQALIRRVSVTPEDAGCQEILGQRLQQLGFETRQLNHGGVHNLWATRGGDGPHLLFAGHTDVVPAGPLEAWDSHPFEPEIRDGKLYGRGAADMKASLAAMIMAVTWLLQEQPALPGRISFLITSDEEGEAIHGTRHAIEKLLAEGIQPDYCVVGEPSSSERLGDVVRCGRRGSLNAKLTVKGIQGHVAYPHRASNPIHLALGALDELAQRTWDQGNNYYPPSSFQISNIRAGTGATNVIPGTLEVDFNFRFNTEQTEASLKAATEACLTAYGLTFDLDWRLSGAPFLTQQGRLTESVEQAILAHQRLQTELSTSGGTSDGRFIAPWGAPGEARVEVIELGPINKTIHQINECVEIDDLMPLAMIYRDIALNLLVE